MGCFGYPQAHEDDARRAVQAALGIVGATDGLNVRVQREHGVRLAVRIGIHTGLVVAGEIAGSEELEPFSIFGEAPNIAARLQGLADANQVVMSAATYRLTRPRQPV